MVDIGLKSGIKAMWQQKGMFHDFIIQVEDWEFRVHKVVLAATSKYFWAMFSEGFIEATADRFELKGRDPYIMSKLLDFIYTENADAIKGKETEVLHCSMYLQMPLVSVFCVKKLLQGMTVSNCQALLATFMEYSFHNGILKVKDFIKANRKMLIELEVVSYEVLEIIVECWEKSEWDMFLFIENWINGDCENRKEYINLLMSKVRFCLIGQKQVTSIKKMSIFSECQGPWRDLVEKAIAYHKLPVNLKVLDKSEQAKLRAEPRPVFFTTGFYEEASTLFALDEENCWRKLNKMMMNVPKFKKNIRPIGISVNNFYIVCTGVDASQEWHIFNPHSLTWSRIAGMAKPRRKFALVHHEEHLYVIGGQYVPNYRESCTEVQRYSFRTNAWHSFGHLPYSVTAHAACVVGDTIYVSGGYDDDFSPSDRFVCLDLSSPSNTWEEKADCLNEVTYHRMAVLRLGGEQVPVIIDDHMQVTYYSLSLEDWFEFDVTADLPLPICEWNMDDMMFAYQDTLFMLNFDGFTIETGYFSGEESVQKIGVCWEWNVSENGVKQIKKFPIHVRCGSQPTVCPFGAVLALPPNL